jgi:hypothetical protein
MTALAPLALANALSRIHDLPYFPEWALRELASGHAAQPSPDASTSDAPSQRAAGGPLIDSEPPVPLPAYALKRWHGDDPKLKADGSPDRSETLFSTGLDLAAAGAGRAEIISALENCDRRLGYNKYINHPEEYARVADKAIDYQATERWQPSASSASPAPALKLVPPKKRWHVIDDDEAEDLPSPEMLVAEAITADALVMLFGQTGIRKSFVALDLALCLAGGRRWHGHDVRSGPVLYVVAEGRGGLRARVRGWKRHHGVTGKIGVHFVDEGVNLQSASDVEAFIAQFLDYHPVLTIFDTYSRCIPGADENAQGPASQVVAHLAQIQEALGGAILIVHHTGKDSKTDRGSSVLRAAMSTVFRLDSTGDFGLKLTCEKQRDIESIGPMGLRWRVVDTGDGSTSCVIEDGDQPVPTLSDNGRAALAALQAGFTSLAPASNKEWLVCSGVPKGSFDRTRGELGKLALVAKIGTGKDTRYYATADGTRAVGAVQPCLQADDDIPFN